MQPERWPLQEHHATRGECYVVFGGGRLAGGHGRWEAVETDPSWQVGSWREGGDGSILGAELEKPLLTSDIALHHRHCSHPSSCAGPGQI